VPILLFRTLSRRRRDGPRSRDSFRRGGKDIRPASPDRDHDGSVLLQLTGVFVKALSIFPVVLFAAAMGLLGPVTARAQTATGSITVSARVVEPPLTGSGVRPLDFGTIVPGSSVTVQPQGPSSGAWEIGGLVRRDRVDFTFELPPSLTNEHGSSIQLSFAGNYAGSCRPRNNQPCEWVLWDPRSPYQLNFNGQWRVSDGNLLVHLGGIASAESLQGIGTYTGTVRLYIQNPT
jgi:hypothetical protein